MEEEQWTQRSSKLQTAIETQLQVLRPFMQNLQPKTNTLFQLKKYLLDTKFKYVEEEYTAYQEMLYILTMEPRAIADKGIIIAARNEYNEMRTVVNQYDIQFKHNDSKMKSILTKFRGVFVDSLKYCQNNIQQFKDFVCDGLEGHQLQVMQQVINVFSYSLEDGSILDNVPFSFVKQRKLPKALGRTSSRSLQQTYVNENQVDRYLIQLYERITIQIDQNHGGLFQYANTILHEYAHYLQLFFRRDSDHGGSFSHSFHILKQMIRFWEQNNNIKTRFVECTLYTGAHVVNNKFYNMQSSFFQLMLTTKDIDNINNRKLNGLDLQLPGIYLLKFMRSPVVFREHGHQNWKTNKQKPQGPQGPEPQESQGSESQGSESQE